MNRTRVGIVAGAGLALTIVVLLVAAGSDPVQVWHDPPPRQESGTGDRGALPNDGPSVGQGKLPLPTASEVGDGWMMRVLAIIVGVVLLRGLWIVVRFWLAVLTRHRNRRVEPAGSFAAMPAAVDDEIDEIVLDTERHIGALDEGTARNAIVACWSRLEHDIAAAGLMPMPSETSAELTERVLSRVAVDGGAVVELADLYREARFSKHEMGDDERDRARAALQRIHASLRSTVAMPQAHVGTVST